MDATAYSPMGLITRLYRGLTRLYTAAPYRLSRSGASFPAQHYFIEVTRRCNLRCKMCQYIEWYKTTPGRVQAEGELTTDEWRNVIDQTARFSLLTFTGGEVFVRKDFVEILEYACARRRVHFISNATMLTEDRARRCAELAPKWFGMRGFNFLGVSIDGTRDVHDIIRAQTGAFDRSIAGVTMLREHRDRLGKRAPLIHMNTVVQEENLDCLPEMPRIAADAGADVLNLLTEMRSLDDYERVGHVDPGEFSREDIALPTINRARLDKALRGALAEARRLGIEVRLPRMPYEEVLNHYDQGYDLAQFECRAVWMNLYIGAKGGVYPCFIQKVGNVREKSLKEIWNGPELRRFRQRRRESGFALCRGCCELEYAGRFNPNPAPARQPASATRDPAAEG